MDQVSRPLLIALVATAFLAAGWMAFMRPAAVESTTEEVTAPARVATQAAKAAAATEEKASATDAAADAVSGEAPATTPAPATATTEKPKATAAAPAKQQEKPAPAKPADGEAELLAELDAGKVVVLLFWDRAGADDRAARDAAKALDRRDGKVAVHVVDVEHVGRYESVTQGVTVAQTPTTMVIAPDGKARTIAGLSESTEVDQLVRDALRKR